MHLLTTIQLRDRAERGIIFIEQAVPLHTFHGNNPHTLIQQFFSVHKTDRQHMEEMETTGLEPVTCRL